jgi:hypothetical protein
MESQLIRALIVLSPLALVNCATAKCPNPATASTTAIPPESPKKTALPPLSREWEAVTSGPQCRLMIAHGFGEEQIEPYIDALAHGRTQGTIAMRCASGTTL